MAISVFGTVIKDQARGAHLLGAFDPLPERLRFWLIRKLAGARPVILNCHVTVPTTLDRPGLYIGNRHSLIVLSSVACNDEMWSKAHGIIETD